jgi:sec-independent protein translocase protein TatA
MFGIGASELLVILLVLLLLFGAERLPVIARNIGEGVREFKKVLKDPQNREPD